MDAAVAFGASLNSADRYLALDVEAELAARFDALHGRNHHHAWDERSADGHWLAQGALTLGAWPRVRIYGPVWLTAGASAGGAVVRAFDDVEWAPTWAYGAGFLLDLPRVDLELRWAHIEMGRTEHDSYRLDYEAEAVSLGVRFK